MEKTIENIQSDKISDEKNILVWLDFDAYAYVNFGIIAALSKLDKFNFIGIVTNHENLSFFQNQQIIPFKKLIYYPDCYIHKSTFDLDKLKNFEKKYDLNLWLDVYAERSFYKYWTEFHKFTKEEILSIIENSISFFVDILEKFKPKLVFMQQPGENISNLLLYRIVKKMNIKILMPNLIHTHNKIIISDNIGSREIVDEYKRIMKDYTNESIIYDDEFIKKSNAIETINIQLKFKSNTTFSQKINHYIKRLSHNPEPVYKNIGKTKLKMIKYKYQNHFEIKKRKQFLDNKSIKSIEDKKFVYYPLQSEPEAKVLTESPFYSNQIALIENIAKSIPIDLILYVKEHPVQKTKLWRSIEDYEKILALPNVKLVHPSVNSQELISKSKGVVVINGSVGFETLFHKKPLILFGDEYYDELSMVTKIKSLTTLPEVISNALSNFKFNNKELNALMQAVNNRTISIHYVSIIKDGVVLSSIQRNENDFNLTIKHFEKFYDTHKNHFELIAQTIYSKI